MSNRPKKRKRYRCPRCGYARVATKRRPYCPSCGKVWVQR